MLDLRPVMHAIRHARTQTPAAHSTLVAISGIDGSGKGYIAARLAQELGAVDISAAVINIDGWLRPPHQRFSSSNPAEHFYLHAIRFEELFSGLVLPLRGQRSCRVTLDFVEETATEARPHTYEFKDVDIILLEGIYLLKRALAEHYDLSVWIDCSFDTALARAIVRAQEGLSVEETIRAYRTIYFPAQQLHFERDRPQSAADMVLDNS